MPKTMRRAFLFPVVALALLPSPLMAQQRGSATQIDVPAGSLSTALIRLAKVLDVELLFDPAALAAKRTSGLHQVLPDEALDRLLANSGYVARRIGPHRYVLVVQRVATTPLPPAAAATPDILVIGSRSLNLDIPRGKDDIQPYRVISADDLARSQGQSADDVLRTGLSSNVQASTERQAPTVAQGSARSEVDLRGFGPLHTLILVDGRRLPSLAATNDFRQPDFNAVPMSAVARIESLGGTAGGIYGPGATGGVVNIVLRHDYPGLWLRGTSGVSDRGDAVRHSVEGGAAWSNDRIRIDVVAGYSSDGGLRFNDRGFAEQAQNLRNQQAPSGLLPVSGAVNILSPSHPLTFSSQFGESSLGSTIATYPVNGGGRGVDELALLRAGAGRFTLPSAEDAPGGQRSLLTAYDTLSLLSSVRQQIGSSVEVFGDLLILQDRGFAIEPRIDRSSVLVTKGSPGNPFNDDVFISYSVPGLYATSSMRDLTERLTGGVIAQLGSGWTMEGEVSLSKSVVLQRTPDTVGLPDIDVFTPGSGLSDAVAAYRPALDRVTRYSNTMRDISVRVAGLLTQLPGGPLSLTLSAEDRIEHNPGPSDDRSGSYQPILTNGLQRMAVTSISSELRIPVVSGTSSLLPLRGLELQVAARGDRYRVVEPNNFDLNDPSAPNLVAARSNTLGYTVGAKVAPVPSVMLRASYAVAELPASLAAMNLLPSSFVAFPQTNPDPKRVGENFRATAPFLLTVLGSPKLPAERARTLSTGIVVRPTALPGVRLSLDYTHIEKTNEANALLREDVAFFLANEAAYPGRTVRAPLTEADAALGYTGGVIRSIDTSAPGSGTTILDAFDMDLQIERRSRWGQFSAKLGISWEPNFRRRVLPTAPFEQLAGHVDGPIEWKGDVVLAWSKGPLGISVDTQFFNDYQIGEGSTLLDRGASIPVDVALQGAKYIPAQAYVDLSVHYTPKGRSGLGKLSYRLTAQNILDQAPPFIVPAPVSGNDATGYSPYGDPRGRRFEFAVKMEF